MPQIIDFGSRYGRVEFPDDWTDTQISAEHDTWEAAREPQRQRQIKRARLQLGYDIERGKELEEPRLSERIGIGLESGRAALPIWVGHAIQAIAPTASEIEASGQMAPAGFQQPEEPRMGEFGWNAPTFRAVGRELVKIGTREQRSAREEAEQLGGSPEAALAGSLAETAVISSQALPFAAFGLPAAAIAAGAQSYGLTKEQFKQQLQDRNPQLSEEEAYRLAEKPAVLSGAITGVLTRTFGGTERLVNRIVEGKLKFDGVKGLLRQAHLAGGLEIPEEGLDQLAQGFLEKAYVNPEKPVSEIINEAGMAALAGYTLGVGTGAVVQAPTAISEAVTRRLRREPTTERERYGKEEPPPVDQGRGTTTPGTTPTATRAPEPGAEAGATYLPGAAGATAAPAVPGPVIAPVPEAQVETGVVVPTAAPPPVGVPGVVTPPQPTPIYAQAPRTETQAGGIPPPQLVAQAEAGVRLRDFTQDRLAAEQGAAVITEALRGYGVEPSPQVAIISDAAPEAPAARTIFDERNNFRRIELNQAKLPNAQEVRRKFEHEVSHVASDSGALREVLGVLTPQERGDIALEMSRLGYPEGSQNEFDARGTDALVSAWRNRTWFGQLVGRVTAWASENLGLKLSRRAAEAIAVRAVGRAFGQVRAPAAQRPGRIDLGNAFLTSPETTRAEAALTAYHGTPNEVEPRFQTSKIGTGEGHQAYGWGLYFAENPSVAQTYQTPGRTYKDPRQVAADTLRDYNGNVAATVGAFQQDAKAGSPFAANVISALANPASLPSPTISSQYTVSLNVAPEELLDWDRPLSEQPGLADKLPQIAAALNREQTLFDPTAPRATGEGIYNALARGLATPYQEKARGRNIGQPRRIPNERAASEFLHSLGIKGVRYLDQGSRNPFTIQQYGDEWEVIHRPSGMLQKGKFKTRQEAQAYADQKFGRQRTSNYVIFDENDINITHRNGQRVTPAQVQQERVEEAKVRLGAIPAWVSPELRAVLETADRQGAPFKVDVTAEWAKLTPQQRQDLVAEGWSVTADRQNRVLIGHTTDVGPNRLRQRVTGERAEEARSPQFFQTRAQVEAAVADPLLQAAQQQEARDLAAVQSTMVNQQFMGWWLGTPVDDADAQAHKRLDYIPDRRFLSDDPRPLSSLPRITQEERRAAELAGAMQLGHYGIDRSVNKDMKLHRVAAVKQLETAVLKLPKMNVKNAEAHYLTAMFNGLTSGQRKYQADLKKAGPASENLRAQYESALTLAEQRLNEQEQAPGTLKKALSTLAGILPSSLLQPGATNAQIVQYALNNATLQGVVSGPAQTWLLVDDGTGQPALLSYAKLREDLSDLRDIINNQQAVAQDISDYEQWFKDSGKAGKVSEKAFAEKYFKFRTGRDRAARIAGKIEKEIGDLDTEIRGLDIAINRLESLMESPGYVETVREASRLADVVTNALYDSADQNTGAGLIDRDLQRGFHVLQVPDSPNRYVIDLAPSSAQEKENRSGLSAYVAEARQYAADNAQTDPLLADEHTRLADYVEGKLLNPSFDPAQGFSQMPWMQIPGTTIRASPDVFDHISNVMGIIGLTFHTARDVLERIGGRTIQQVSKDAYELDRVMKKVEGIRNNPKFGDAAKTQATLKAVQSHGWSVDQISMWDEQVAEPILAAGQNNLGPNYEVGDVVVGSGVKVTKEDMEAMRLQKQLSDAILAAAPPHIQEILGGLGITRKAAGTGRFTMSRVGAWDWAADFVQSVWPEAKTDAEKIALLDKQPNFRRLVMGYLGQFNPEMALANNASPNKSPLFLVYRRLAETEKKGVQNFTKWDEVLDFLANRMVEIGMSPDFSTARDTAEKTLLSEITGFIAAYNANVLNAKAPKVWGGVPDTVVDVASANNAFTLARGPLQAPSTFYTYSLATDGRTNWHIGNLRSLMNLKLLQSMEEALKALEVKKGKMDDEIEAMVETGVSKRKATKQVLQQTMRDRKASEIRYDYRELTTTLKILSAVRDQLRRFETTKQEAYQHAGQQAMQSLFAAFKSGLLAAPQSITTNTWTGLLFGPAMLHWQSGQYLKAIRDVLPSPVGTPSVVRVLYRQAAALVAGNPIMSKLLKQHAPMWNWFSKQIVDAAADWHRVENIAEMSGMVSPYNLLTEWKNRAALKRSGGRIELDQPTAAAAINTFLSLPGVRHVTGATRAFAPRSFDNFINYSLIVSFDKELDFLKKISWAAFQAREETAKKSGQDWTDLTDANNLLTPGDLGFGTHKAIERYRQLFDPIGFDGMLLDFYQRTKGMTPQQRRAEPLILDENEYAGIALQYAAITNVATETNRPLSFKGKGSDGVWRNMAGTFMGWPINAAKQLGKALQTHSKDSAFDRIAMNFLGLAFIILLMAAVGAWNWEFGDLATELVTDVSSPRIQIGNIQDVQTAIGYFMQALPNVVPLIGSSIGSAAGVAFTGRGSPFDMTSQILHLNLAADTWNTIKRVIQTGDITLPAADFARRWVIPPLSKAIINRLPLMRGMVDQQNAVRSLNASAPPGTEIKWGQRGGGEARYGPANDEIMKLIGSAYEATAHGGDVADVQARLEDAIQAYMRAGRSRADAIKAVGTALASKEPARILTGREMTPEEERRWVSRMTSGQKADYDRAVGAWGLLGNVTGKDLGMVSYPGGGGGGAGRGSLGGIPSAFPRARAIPGGFPSRRRVGLRAVGGLRRVGISTRAPRLARARVSVPAARRRRAPAGGLRRPGLRRVGLRRLAGPRIARVRTSPQRFRLPNRRRRRQGVA